jgi:4a-hydroxytetrahydrobiopterin dehydratase
VEPTAWAALLAELPGWELREGALRRTFQFSSFGEALGFVVRVGALAERHDHHPEWSNVYGRVDLAWTTHDRGGVTWLDVEMARQVSRFVGSP